MYARCHSNGRKNRATHTHTCTQQSFGKVSHSLPVLHVVVVVIFAAATAAATAAAASVVEW